MNRRIARVLVLVVALTGSVATVGVSPALALSNTPDNLGWRLVGKVFAFAHSGNVLYVGGHFKQVIDPLGRRQRVGSIAAFDLTTGAWDSSFTPIVGGDTHLKVNALAVSPDGSTLYAGGSFDSVNALPVKNFAAIDLATGQLVPGFDVSPGGAVNAILTGQNLIYLGGAFSQVDGKRRRHLAAVDYNGTLSQTWTPSTEAGDCPSQYYDPEHCSNGGNGTVRSLAFSLDQSRIYIGGEYYYLNGVPRNCIGRVSATDGSLDPWAVPFDQIDGDAQNHKPGPNMAWAIVPTDTRVYVGFGRIPNFLQAFRLDNGDVGDRVWKDGTPGNVESVALSSDGSRLFFGGHFGTARLDFRVDKCSAWVHGLLSVNPVDGSIDCDWIPPIKPFGGENAPGSGQSSPNWEGAWAMSVIGNALWVGGYFTSISDANVSGFARFTVDGSAPPPPPLVGHFLPKSGPVGTVLAITGFAFSGATDVRVRGVSAPFTVNDDGHITATVPPGARTGKITVVTPGGTADSSTNFHVIR